MVPGVASFADSHLKIENSAVGVDFAADAVIVKAPSLRALNTEAVFPFAATVVIVDQLQEFRVVEFRSPVLSVVVWVLNNDSLGIGVGDEKS